MKVEWIEGRPTTDGLYAVKYSNLCWTVGRIENNCSCILLIGNENEYPTKDITHYCPIEGN